MEGTNMPPDLGLSARDIVDLLLKGKKVTIEFSTQKEYRLFFSNLQVEKSRKRHAHEDFGLDFENKVIKVISPTGLIPALEIDKELEFASPQKFTFFATDPTPPKKYSIFQIID